MSSSAFHPATIGALYGVMATHEQALIQMALAANVAQADVDPEIAERYAAVVDDVKRLIAFAKPDQDDHMPIEGMERKLRAHALMGRLLHQLSDFRITSWELDPTAYKMDVRAMLHRSYGGSHAAIRTIAERLGITFSSEPFAPSDGDSEYVAASGEIDGVMVEVWSVLPIEQQIGHAAGIACSENPCPICVEESAAAEVDTGLGDDGTYEGGFTDAQLDGTSCSECGVDFAEGAATVPTGAGVREQLAAHPDCLTDTTTEPPGDTP